MLLSQKSRIVGILLIYTVAVMKELGLITQIGVVGVLKAGLIQLTFSKDGIHCLTLRYCN